MSSIEPKDPLFSEAELKRVLEVWLAPEPSRALDERVSNSYYRELGSNESATQKVALPQSQNEVVTMKFCSTCREEFADKFSFCPVDGTPLNGFVPKDESVTRAAAQEPVPPVTPSVPPVTPSVTNSPAYAAAAAGSIAAESIIEKEEFHFTFIDDAGLFQRLLEAAKDVAHESELTWPEFKRDPFGFSKRMITGYSQAGWRAMSQPNVATGILSALFLVMAIVLGVFLIDKYQIKKSEELAAAAEVELADTLIDIPNEQPTPEAGPAGLNKGTGGGSKPKPEKAGGGGGGGRQEQKEASFGKTPQASLTVPQVVAPDPKPPTIKNPSLPVPATLVGDPLLIPPDARVMNYGDPKSKSTELSSGTGTGNGIGSGNGGGIGPGDGSGVGPGRDGNIGGGDRRDGGGGPGGGGGGDYTRVFSPKEVTSKAKVLSKPEPQYTEEARKNQITGTVVLRAVFTSGGQVTNIKSVTGLPFGLTEKAIAAARQIKFSPAMKDGHAVSMYIQLEYSFNLY